MCSGDIYIYFSSARILCASQLSSKNSCASILFYIAIYLQTPKNIFTPCFGSSKGTELMWMRIPKEQWEDAKFVSAKDYKFEIATTFIGRHFPRYLVVSKIRKSLTEKKFAVQKIAYNSQTRVFTVVATYTGENFPFLIVIGAILGGCVITGLTISIISISKAIEKAPLTVSVVSIVFLLALALGIYTYFRLKR